MAFTSIGGYTNLPSGNFVPVIFSKKVLKFFRKTAVVEAITNTDFYGEISNFGDTVRVIKEPTVTVGAYYRGLSLVPQDLADDETTLTVDKANYFLFKVDDIEKKQSHINWEELATSSAAYALKDTYDSEVLTYMVGQVSSANVYGSNASPIDTGFGSSEEDPANVIARLARLMDDVNIPRMNRWLVARPAFYEQLMQTSSKLMDVSFIKGSGDTSNVLNGKVIDRPVHGFDLYQSNNLPNPSGSNATHYVFAGHMSSTATAQQIAITERYRDPNSFADNIRGLHLYGRKTLRPEALSLAYIKID